MFNYYSSEKIRLIAFEWESNELLKERMSILRNVIMAHNLGMYNVTIPTLLTQLEGVLIDTFNIRGKVDGKIIELLLECLLKDDNNESGFNFDTEIHEYYTKNIIQSFKHGEPIKSGISRNAILHGADKRYGILSNSLKTILLFDYISNAGFCIDKDKQQRGREKIKIHRKNRYPKKRK